MIIKTLKGECMKTMIKCILIAVFIAVGFYSSTALSQGKLYENFVGKDCPGGSYNYCDGYMYYLKGNRCGTFFKDQGMSQRSLSDANQPIPFCVGNMRRVFYVANSQNVMNWITNECASPVYVMRKSVTVGPAGRISNYCQLK